MTQEESSVISSLRQLRLEQEQQCIEQARLEQLRARLHAQAVLRESAAAPESARQRQELAKRDALRAADEQRLEREQRERELDIERFRVESELRAKVQLMQLKQEHSIQRLAIERDAKVRRLEGQRVMISSLLGTLLIGAIAVWGLLIGPQFRNREGLVRQLTLAHAAARNELQQQRTKHEAQISDLESRNRDLQSQLAVKQAKSLSTVEPRQGAKPPHPIRPEKPVRKQTACDAGDPLCGDLG